jgi:hypothetical protein
MDKSLRYADQYFEPIEDSRLIKQIDVTECDWCGEVRSEETTFDPADDGLTKEFFLNES